jgi:hypothetical protein
MSALLPFLNNGFTVEYFNRVGKIPVIMDLLLINNNS